jgi:regulator of cell morphogenesis and NO signaling
MMQDHENEGERMRKIAALSDNYIPGSDACTMYKAWSFMLEEFESDQHKHTHLEKELQAAY